MNLTMIDILNFESNIAEICKRIKHGVFPFSKVKDNGDCLNTDMLCYDDTPAALTRNSLCLSEEKKQYVVYEDCPVVKTWTRYNICDKYSSDKVEYVLRRTYNQTKVIPSYSVRVRIKELELDTQIGDVIGVNINSKGEKTYVSKQYEILESYKYLDRGLNNALKGQGMCVKTNNVTEQLAFTLAYEMPPSMKSAATVFVNIPSFWKASSKVRIAIDEIDKCFLQIRNEYLQKRKKDNQLEEYLHEIARLSLNELIPLQDLFDKFELGECIEQYIPFVPSKRVCRIFTSGRYIGACVLSESYGFTIDKEWINEDISPDGTIIISPNTDCFPEYKNRDGFHWEIKNGKVTAVFKDTKGRKRNKIIYITEKDELQKE